MFAKITKSAYSHCSGISGNLSYSFSKRRSWCRGICHFPLSKHGCPIPLPLSDLQWLSDKIRLCPGFQQIPFSHYETLIQGAWLWCNPSHSGDGKRISRWCCLRKGFVSFRQLHKNRGRTHVGILQQLRASVHYFRRGLRLSFEPTHRTASLHISSFFCGSCGDYP